ncbi:MAG: uracil-DNA glycosylase [Pirellulaceae bacterium]
MTRLNKKSQEWQGLNQSISQCQACPRLTEHCQRIAREKRRAYSDQAYWGRPVPNFGHADAAILIVGLAPGAHGANRTGRMFTGDRSGDWLYRALHRATLASQPASTTVDDGMVLTGCAITAVCHCAPPDNKPSTDEVIACRHWLDATVDLADARVYIALGQLAWKETLRLAERRGWIDCRPPKFAHLAELELHGPRWLIGSYHPSQQNTFTGRLTEAMFDAVFQAAVEKAGRGKQGGGQRAK